ncbi:MAG: helix-turn-helix domain-containing protein [Pseudonocardiaceae bacterium]
MADFRLVGPARWQDWDGVQNVVRPVVISSAAEHVGDRIASFPPDGESGRAPAIDVCARGRRRAQRRLLVQQSMPATTTSRILLGRELARLREAAGVSRDRAAHKISRTRNHIGNIETGRNPPSSLDELRQLVSFYQASPVDPRALEQLWADANRSAMTR